MAIPSSWSIDQLLKDRPDILQEFQRASSTADRNSPVFLQKGLDSINNYVNYWYDQLGGRGSYEQTPTVPTVETPDYAGLRKKSFDQALSKAKQAVSSRGLNWEDYDDELLLPRYQEIYDTIGENETSPDSYFSPNLANDILGGAESRQRNLSLNAINSEFNNPLSSNMLDDTVSRILGESETGAMDQITRAQKRGQINDVGYNAALSKLNDAKTKARASLQTSAQDVLGGYDAQFRDIRNSATQAASGQTLGSNFNLDTFRNDFSNARTRAEQGAEGALLGAIDTDSLIDIGSLRQAAGEKQGALNLQNTDVLDGLAKRKNANSAGRGLGSQGAF